ncbi:plastocyanin/azurin family copper-binding protein [Haloplanus sp. C73]|uniref:plastocyanin/azurin family copper-binding protein n=1 Tax=Haloplanus sp. C73 TaxID=3421641 RepID=UPI003EC0BBD1
MGGWDTALRDETSSTGRLSRASPDSPVVPPSPATFEHTFQKPGEYLYSSLPHEGLGMRGAVIVE